MWLYFVCLGHTHTARRGRVADDLEAEGKLGIRAQAGGRDSAETHQISVRYMYFDGFPWPLPPIPRAPPFCLHLVGDALSPKSGL